jgi:hypothetical protein
LNDTRFLKQGNYLAHVSFRGEAEVGRATESAA